MQTIARWVTGVCVSLVDAGAVLALRPDWSELVRHLRAPRAWLASVGPDAAAIELGSAALWCLAVWLAVGLVGAVAGRLPGRCGRLCVRVSELALPAIVQRVLVGTAGLGVLLAPVAAGAHTASPTGGSANPIPAPSWPLNSPSTPPRASLPGLTTRPDPAHADPPTALPRTVRPKTPRDRSSERVLVRPGDSLWLIAARRLGTAATEDAVATEWPRWYATNRAAIGDDPDLIHPGQVLHSPGEETS
jgi:resuscitation-promoting factor RpfA